MLPYDKDAMLDFLEVLEFNLRNPISSYFSAKLFIKHHGVEILLGILKAAHDEEMCFELGLTVFQTQLQNKKVILRLLRLGGLDFIVANEMKYADYESIHTLLVKLRVAMIDCGSFIALKEIKYQYEMLRLCESCQKAIEKDTRVRSSTTNPMVFASSMNERVERILNFMSLYILKYNLQCHGLDAILLFVQKKDLEAIFKSPTLVQVVGKTLHEYMETKPGVIWRACLVLQQLAEMHKDLAKDIALLDVHDKLCMQYARLTKRPRVQQIILRFMAALARWHHDDLSRVVLQQSSACMTLFVAIEKHANEASKHRRSSILEAVDGTAQTTHFAVLLPLQLRTFLRESNRQVLALPQAPMTEEAKRHHELLANAKVLKPLYGTTREKYFAEGEKGLVDM